MFSSTWRFFLECLAQVQLGIVESWLWRAKLFDVCRPLCLHFVLLHCLASSFWPMCSWYTRCSDKITWNDTPVWKLVSWDEALTLKPNSANWKRKNCIEFCVLEKKIKKKRERDRIESRVKKEKKRREVHRFVGEKRGEGFKSVTRKISKTKGSDSRIEKSALK